MGCKALNKHERTPRDDRGDKERGLRETAQWLYGSGQYDHLHELAHEPLMSDVGTPVFYWP